MENVKIVGCGYARASSKIENEALKKAVDTSDEWIQTRTGIASRYISETENTSDLAIRAAQKAIQNAQINTSQISMIIVATCTPDNVTPSVACIVQEAFRKRCTGQRRKLEFLRRSISQIPTHCLQHCLDFCIPGIRY